jgi:hypothetical protein
MHRLLSSIWRSLEEQPPGPLSLSLSVSLSFSLRVAAFHQRQQPGWSLVLALPACFDGLLADGASGCVSFFWSAPTSTLRSSVCVCTVVPPAPVPAPAPANLVAFLFLKLLLLLLLLLSLLDAFGEARGSTGYQYGSESIDVVEHFSEITPGYESSSASAPEPEAEAEAGVDFFSVTAIDRNC